MSAIDDALVANHGYAARHGTSALRTEPRRRLAVLTCMDSRLDLFGALGLELGDAHLIRNAGGLATEDAVRSLLLSQQLLGTREVMVVHHTRCGLEHPDEAALRARLEDALERPVTIELGAFGDVRESVRATLATLRANPLLRSSEVRGFVFDVDDGRLSEVGA
jgi:carbonic anhydrase